MSEIVVRYATPEDHKYAQAICDEMAESAKARGTGIARRSPEYLVKQMDAGKAIIAIHKPTQQVAGFCYIESWGHQKYVANSGLIVFPDFRNHGLATRIKEAAFKLSRKKFPDAKLFGLTTSTAVMKINSELGYRPVIYNELTDDEEFWKGCQSCVNYDILQSKGKKNCICTAMLYDPEEKKRKKWDFIGKSKIYDRLKRIKLKTFGKDVMKSFLGKTNQAKA